MRRSLFDDDEEPISPRPRRRLEIEGPEGFGLLSKMDSVIRIKGHKAGEWHARAQGCPHFAAGDSPEEAMRAALRKKNDD